MTYNFTPAQMRKAVTCWQDGKTYAEIAAALKTTPNGVRWLIRRNRDRFPLRYDKPGNREAQEAAASRPAKPDRVLRTTASGYTASVARVSFIDGRAP